jgi:hypothetical protein
LLVSKTIAEHHAMLTLSKEALDEAIAQLRLAETARDAALHAEAQATAALRSSMQLRTELLASNASLARAYREKVQ